MKDYHEYGRVELGYSDIASLVMVGFKHDEGVVPEMLRFYSDGCYGAYLVDEYAEIGSHYKEVASYDSWLKIYDDHELVFDMYAKHFTVYRAANMGCIIKVIGRAE